MREVDTLLDDIFLRRERLTRDEIYRRAVAADAPTQVVDALDGLPEGEYAQDEVTDAMGEIGEPTATPGAGVAGKQLPDDDLIRELFELHRTRNDTLRHGSDHALARHTERLGELEHEYLRRYPEREVDPERLRAGARARSMVIRTGSDQPWDPEDLVRAQGRELTEANMERARQELSEGGPEAIEKWVP